MKCYKILLVSFLVAIFTFYANDKDIATTQQPPKTQEEVNTSKHFLSCNDEAKNCDPLKELSEILLHLKTKATEIIMTVMVYIAADNDLHIFAWRNIRQLAEIAPNNVRILVFLTEPGKNKKTQIYLVEKNKSTPLNTSNVKLDSGDPKTLIDFCTYCIQNYPAKEYSLILWNHGTGIIDPFKKPIRNRINSPAELFSINPATLQLEVDRTISFLDYIIEEEQNAKGVCFDDTYNSYLTNQKLEYALSQIKNGPLNGNKFAILGMDACLMAMVEIASLAKNYANHLVASQEIELGAGWRYDKVMRFYLEGQNSPAFAKHMVKAYKEAYEKITPDYTLSSTNLDQFDALEKNIDDLAKTLITCLNLQSGSSVKNTIRMSKEKIHFDEASYIDLGAFCEKLIANINYMKLSRNEDALKKELIENANLCLYALSKVITANTYGRNVAYAKGLSIYFPERSIHSSYEKTIFATKNNWFNLIIKYIST